LRPAWAKSETPSQKYPTQTQKKASGVAPVVQHLSSNFSTAKKKKKTIITKASIRKNNIL
jgi:hypothetical protein